jgi:hypothetical protein
MAKSTTVLTQKKKRGPKPTGKGTLVGVRLHNPELSALDTWREDQDPVPTRPEAIRYALRDWLTHMGILPISSKKTGA